MEQQGYEHQINRSEVVERGLKHKSEVELWDDLIDGSAQWPEQQQAQLWLAYDLARIAHIDDRHKDVPYVNHLLRVANRVRFYLETDNPNIVIAALLHDVVEDHPIGVGSGNYTPDAIPERLSSSTDVKEMTPRAQQYTALRKIELFFSAEVSEIVSAVTNVPAVEAPSNYEEKLSAYAEKVRTSIQLTEAWFVKFSDWCDNGVGINYGAESRSAERDAHFRRKYGMVLPILEQRFYEEDIQMMLSEPAKAYVRHQFQLGRERLTLAA